MVKDHSDSERRNPLTQHGLLFSISSKCSFICIIPDRIAHTTHGLLVLFLAFNKPCRFDLFYNELCTLFIYLFIYLLEEMKEMFYLTSH